jgi:hypothetical protein
LRISADIAQLDITGLLFLNSLTLCGSLQTTKIRHDTEDKDMSNDSATEGKGKAGLVFHVYMRRKCAAIGVIVNKRLFEMGSMRVIVDKRLPGVGFDASCWSADAGM